MTSPAEPSTWDDRGAAQQQQPSAAVLCSVRVCNLVAMILLCVLASAVVAVSGHVVQSHTLQFTRANYGEAVTVCFKLADKALETLGLNTNRWLTAAFDSTEHVGRSSYNVA